MFTWNNCDIDAGCVTYYDVTMVEDLGVFKRGEYFPAVCLEHAELAGYYTLTAYSYDGEFIKSQGIRPCVRDY